MKFEIMLIYYGYTSYNNWKELENCISVNIPRHFLRNNLTSF